MDDKPCTSLFVFDANKIAEAISDQYGAWAEAELLQSLGNLLQPYGGWTLLMRTIQGCHGDMFRGEYRTLCQLAKTGTYGRFRLNTVSLDPPLLDDLQSDAMSTDLFVVGLSPLDQSDAAHIDQELRRRAYPDYYRGLVMFTGEPSIDYILQNTNLSRTYLENLRATNRLGYDAVVALSCCPYISDIAGSLHLVFGGIEISRGGRCKGWLPKHETLRSMGLAPN